jgi:tRNA(Ile)-lysidine synthetase-like protein
LAQDGVRHHILTWEHPPITAALQAQARHARYDLLVAWCARHPKAFLLVAHHQDDQHETIWMRLQRGRGGLQGMQPKRRMAQRAGFGDVVVLRPLLAEKRTEIERYARAHGVQWVQDPSNENRTFERVRTRQTLQALPAKKLVKLDNVRQFAHAKYTKNAQELLDFAPYFTLSPFGFQAFSYRAFADLSHGAQLLMLQRIWGSFGHFANAGALRQHVHRWQQQRAPQAFTLAGVRCSVGAGGFSGDVIICPEMGALPGKTRLAPYAAEQKQQGSPLPPSRWGVFYNVSDAVLDITAYHTLLHVGVLSRSEKKAIKTMQKQLPMAVRPVLPMVRDAQAQQWRVASAADVVPWWQQPLF